jgi:hypothetical protein
MYFTRKFYKLYEVAIFKYAREIKSSSRNLITILIVNFIAMAVAL